MPHELLLNKSIKSFQNKT